MFSSKYFQFIKITQLYYLLLSFSFSLIIPNILLAEIPEESQQNAVYGTLGSEIPEIIPGQVVRIYGWKANPGKKKTWEVTSEYSLQDLDIQMPMMEMQDLRDLRVKVNREARELILQRIDYDRITNTERIICEHVFTNIEVEKFVHDGQFLFFSALYKTKSGGEVPARILHSLFLKQFEKLGFKASLPAPVIMPLTAPVEEMEFYTGNDPVETKDENTEVPSEKTRVRKGDLRVKFKVEEQGKEAQFPEVIFERKEVRRIMRLRLLANLLFMQIVSPDFKSLKAIHDIFAANGADIRNSLEEMKQILVNTKRDDGVLKSKTKTDQIILSALKTLSQRNGMTWLTKLLEKNKEGKDLLQALDDIPVDEYEVDAATGKEIHNVEMQVTDRVLARTESLAEKILTPKKLAAAATAIVGLTTYALIHKNPLKSAAALGMQFLDWSIGIPFINVFTSPAHNLIHYINSYTQFWSWGLGTVTMMSFRALAMLGTYAYSAARAYKHKHPVPKFNEENITEEFFNAMLHLYAGLNRPIQEVFYWVTRQKNVYFALQNNINPLKAKNVFNSPIASEEEIRQNRLKIQKGVSDQADHKSFVQTVAALALVSQMKGIDPISLQISKETGLSELNEIYSNPELRVQYEHLLKMFYPAILELGKQKNLNIDKANFAENIKEYIQVANRILELQRRQKMGTLDKVKEKLRDFSDDFMDSVVPFFLFGAAGKRLYESFKDLKIDSETLKLCAAHYKSDYAGTTLILSGETPEDISMFHSNGRIGPHPRIWTMEVGSILYYGGGLPANHLTTRPLFRAKSHNPPRTDVIHGKKFIRKQTFFEALAIMIEAAFDPDVEGTLATHAQFIQNKTDGLQARMIIEGLPTWLTFQLEGIKKSAIFSNLYMTAHKMSLQVDRKGKVTVGYAMIWSFVSRQLRILSDAADANRLKVQVAASLIEKGIRFQDKNLMQTGVKAMKILYKEGESALGRRMSEEFNKPSDEYDFKKAEELLVYSTKHIPLPTEISWGMKWALNFGLGTIISTVLYNDLSLAVFSAGGALAEFVITAAWMGVNYAGSVLGDKHVVRPLLKKVHPHVKRINKAVSESVLDCRRWLTRESVILVN